ncbi:MAG: CRTAC1 family protein, partial [Pseudomonadota bacterium]
GAVVATGTGSSHFALLSNLTGTAALDIGVALTSLTVQVLDSSRSPFFDATDLLGVDPACPGVCQAIDAVAVDLDGDLMPDIFGSGGEKASDVMLADPLTIEAHVQPKAGEQGFEFVAAGTVSVALYPTFSVSQADVHIGSAGWQPDDIEFSLSSADPTVNGMPVYVAGQDTGFFLGRDPDSGVWRVMVSAGTTTLRRNLVVSAEQPIELLGAVGFDPDAAPPSDVLLRLENGVFQNRVSTAGFDGPSAARSIAAGDFDNDMDIDLYLVATGPVANLPNLLYENLGGGTFRRVTGAGGAEGSLKGRGDSVSVVDYDGDGFLDLFVTNGTSKAPFERDGPYELFRNLGNDNHWLALDLNGVQSNRDGIGARVTVTAGGRTQLREQTNGMHHRTQNHRRLHFGLGANTRADTIVIHWPSGIRQVLRDIAADQVLQVVEPAQPGS